MNTEKLEILPQPFLRWAGGKRKLVESLIRSFPRSFVNSKNDFYEPFVGGGALMLALGDKNLPVFVSGNRLLINDANPDLVDTYNAIRDDVETLIEKLEVLARDVSKKAFLRVRSRSTPR